MKLSTLNSKATKVIDFLFFLLFFEQTSQQLVMRLFGCYYFKSCRCWTWRGSDTHARSFICALKWNDRLTGQENISSDLSSLLFCWSFWSPVPSSALVWLAPGAELKLERVSRVECARKDVLCLYKCNSCQEKRDRSSNCVWGSYALC